MEDVADLVCPTPVEPLDAPRGRAPVCARGGGPELREALFVKLVVRLGRPALDGEKILFRKGLI